VFTPKASYALDRLDQRKPLPLLPMGANHQKQNLREHLEVVEEIVAATSSRDYAKVAEGSQAYWVLGSDGANVRAHGCWRSRFTEQAWRDLIALTRTLFVTFKGLARATTASSRC
jgi:hypothetical protein